MLLGEKGHVNNSYAEVVDRIWTVNWHVRYRRTMTDLCEDLWDCRLAVVLKCGGVVSIFYSNLIFQILN